ncbi:MAG: hypothetical protein VX938_12410 [Myxococcota bacterium]|nr:hypothetical protein [Myxococcota bacterium]
MKSAARRLTGLLLALPVGLLLVCGSPEPDPLGEPDITIDAPDPDQLGGVSYILSWTSSQAHEIATGWEVTNDLGYRVRLTSGWLTTYSVQLVPCSGDDREDNGWLRRLLGGRPAYAGHGGSTDPSAITIAHVEELTTPTDQLLGPVEPGEGRYCQVHYLLGPAEGGARGLPETPDLMDSSLFLQGAWGAPGAAPTQPFQIQSSLAMGEMMYLYPPDRPGDADASFALDTGTSNATVRVTRNLDTLFDGVDFGLMDDVGLQKAVLQAVVKSLEITVESR